MMPCIGCAACCHYEVEVLSGVDDVPEHLTWYDGNQQKMRRKFGSKVCIALDEKSGSCTIYDRRPTVCQQFKRESRGCYAAVYLVFGAEALTVQL